MANGYEASPAAQVTWERVRGLLSVYYAAGMQGFGRSSWRQSLGARVQCSIDALGLLHLVLSADAAMTALRKCDVKAYTLAMKDNQLFLNGRPTPYAPAAADYGATVASSLRPHRNRSRGRRRT